jgi:hypothetical protein
MTIWEQQFMTDPDLYRRVQALEQRMTVADEQRRQLLDSLTRLEAKVDRLLTAAAMGRGAFWFATRLGGLIVMAAGAFGWAADHFGWWKH